MDLLQYHWENIKSEHYIKEFEKYRINKPEKKFCLY